MATHNTSIYWQQALTGLSVYLWMRLVVKNEENVDSYSDFDRWCDDDDGKMSACTCYALEIFAVRFYEKISFLPTFCRLFMWSSREISVVKIWNSSKTKEETHETAIF